MVSGKIKQTYQGLSASYEVIESGNNLVATAEVPLNVLFGSIKYTRDGISYTLQYDPKLNLNKSKANYRNYTILDFMGEPIGAIRMKYQKRGWFSGYYYHEVDLYGATYRVYVVGLGKNGIKHVVYKLIGGEEVQVALVSKPAVVYDMKDLYSYYSIDEVALDVSTMYTLYHDCINHGHHGSIVYSSKEVTYYTTTNKYLKAKYDIDFLSKNF